MMKRTSGRRPLDPTPNVERRATLGVLGRRWSLGRILGFDIGIDSSWFLLVILITWSLAEGVFPSLQPGLSVGVYWLMGVVGALGLFGSVILHEMSHALVARRHGVEMRGITLFVFGGVAQMGSEPPTPRAESLVAIAGPIASFGIAGVCFGINVGLVGMNAPPPVTITIGYLATINGLLAAFNLIPAFPLDGGRILRSALWRWKGSLRWATRVTSEIGAGFGLALVVLGVFTLISGNPIGGVWWAVLGIFLRFAARMSYRQLVIRRALEGEMLSRFIRTEPVTVPTLTSLDEFVEGYVYRHYHKMYPVVDNGRLVGRITTSSIASIPREQWSQRHVGDIAEEPDANNTANVHDDPMDALSKMNATGVSRLMVLDDGHLVGIVTLKDLLSFLSLKIDFEDTIERQHA